MYIRIFHFDTEAFHFFVFLLVTEELLCSRVGRTLGSRVVVGACPPLIIFSHLSPSIRPHIISPLGPSNPRPLQPPSPPNHPLPPSPCLICKCYPSPPPHQIHFAVQSGKTAAGGRAAHRRLCVRRQRRPDTGGVHARHLPPLHPAQGTSLNILEPDWTIGNQFKPCGTSLNRWGPVRTIRNQFEPLGISLDHWEPV